MINLLKQKLKMASIRAEHEQMLVEAELETARQQLRFAQEASNLFIDDEAAFKKSNFETGDAVTEENFQTMQENAYKMWRSNSMVNGWIEMAVSFIVGSEFHIKSIDEDPATQDAWDNFWRAESFSLKAMEIVRRTLRDGECFIRIFPVRPDKKNPYAPVMTIRFLDPMRVKTNPDKSDTTQFGVETDPQDIENVKAYWYDTTGQNDFERIDAAQIIHVKRSDSDFKRGVPWLLPIFRDVRELEKIFLARQMLHKIRASVIIDQEVRGASVADAAQALIDRQKSRKEGTNPLKQGSSVKSTPIGGIFVHNDNVKRTYQTPNLQAIDADADIRRHLLKCAVQMGWAEYATTADASNSNYASTMIAESPMVKTFLREQTFFADAFNKLHRKHTQLCIDAKLLVPVSTKTVKTLSGDTITENRVSVPRPLDAICAFPNLIHRDYLQETQALLLQRREGALSLRTLQIKCELDPEEEALNLRAEAAMGIVAPTPDNTGATNSPGGQPNPNEPNSTGAQLPAPNEPADRRKSRTRPTNR